VYQRTEKLRIFDFSFLKPEQGKGYLLRTMRVVMNSQETFLLQLSRFVQAALMMIFDWQNHFVFSQARNENIARM